MNKNIDQDEQMTIILIIETFNSCHAYIVNGYIVKKIFVDI